MGKSQCSRMEEGANVMIMIGCDFHPGLEELALLDTETGQRRQHCLSHAFGLDPARIRKAAPRRQKTDRNDARLLLQLLEENRFPRIWVPDRATRDLRQLLMHRHKLVILRGAIGNQLQAIAMNRGMQKKGRLWSREGREQLKSLILPPWTTRRRDELLSLREQWDREIAELDQVVLREAERSPEARYLMHRQPGVGPITALAVVLTLGPVERFASARKVASYAGLVPAEYSSGARQRLGHLSKEGNPFLRWVLVESATVAVRHDPEMKRMYWRLVERRGKSIAKVAMARKLLTRLYWMLRRRNEGRGLRQRSRVAGELGA